MPESIAYGTLGPDTPGPGSYAHTDFKTSGPSYTVGRKNPSKDPRAALPGPGEYLSSTDPTDRNSVSVSIAHKTGRGGAFDEIFDKRHGKGTTPGPGSYSYPARGGKAPAGTHAVPFGRGRDPEGSSRSGAKRTPREIHRDRERRAASLRGPGSYDHTGSASIDSPRGSRRAPAYSFGPRPKSSPSAGRLESFVRRDARAIPGPGAYGYGSREGERGSVASPRGGGHRIGTAPGHVGLGKKNMVPGPGYYNGDRPASGSKGPTMPSARRLWKVPRGSVNFKKG